MGLFTGMSFLSVMELLIWTLRWSSDSAKRVPKIMNKEPKKENATEVEAGDAEENTELQAC